MNKITDDQGQVLDRAVVEEEPYPASVVLTDGEFGTAWQRQFSGEQLWVRLGGGQAVTWEWLLANKRNIVLVYDAAERN